MTAPSPDPVPLTRPPRRDLVRQAIRGLVQPAASGHADQVRQLLHDASHPPHTPYTIGILGLHPGSGRTTIVTLLAAAFTALHGQPTGLLDTTHTTVGAGAMPPYPLASQPAPPAPLHSRLPAHLGTTEITAPDEHAAHAIDSLRRRYHLTLVDTPPIHTNQISFALLGALDAIVLTTSPHPAAVSTLPAIHNWLAGARQRRPPATVVAVHTSPTESKIRRTGRVIHACLGYDPALTASPVNLPALGNTTIHTALRAAALCMRTTSDHAP